MDFNLLRDPWIRVTDRFGYPREVSLAELLADPEGFQAVSDGPADVDVLTGAATMRLVVAVYAAAVTAGVPAAEWAARDPNRWDLFGDRPFGQCSLIAPHVDVVAAPAVMLPLTTAKNGPTLLSHDHGESNVRYSPAEAARLLLVRQAYGTAQRQPFKATVFGAAATHGPNTTCLTRPFLWVEGQSVADTLAASWTPGLGEGVFLNTWPDGWKPGTAHHPTGPVSVLTWPSRAMLLIPDRDGWVSQVAYGGGAVWDTTDPVLQPNAAYLPDRKDPAKINPVRAVSGYGWSRRLLAAWVNPARYGLLGHLKARPTGDRAGLTLRWAGLVADKGRIDAVMDRTLPVPTVSDTDLMTWLDGISTVYSAAMKRASAAAHAAHHLGGKDAATRQIATLTRRLDPRVDDLSADVATGAVTAADALDTLTDLSRAAMREIATTHFTPTRAAAAALPLETTT